MIYNTLTHFISCNSNNNFYEKFTPFRESGKKIVFKERLLSIWKYSGNIMASNSGPSCNPRLIPIFCVLNCFGPTLEPTSITFAILTEPVWNLANVCSWELLVRSYKFKALSISFCRKYFSPCSLTSYDNSVWILDLQRHQLENWVGHKESV